MRETHRAVAGSSGFGEGRARSIDYEVVGPLNRGLRIASYLKRIQMFEGKCEIGINQAGEWPLDCYPHHRSQRHDAGTVSRQGGCAYHQSRLLPSR
jgi:hypothetical protein